MNKKIWATILISALVVACGGGSSGSGSGSGGSNAPPSGDDGSATPSR